MCGSWATALTSEAVLQKYHVSFLYDVKGFLDSLDAVEALEGRLFIPSHAFPVEDVRLLVKLNRDKTMEVLELVLALCGGGTAFEEILKGVFDRYNLHDGLQTSTFWWAARSDRICRTCWTGDGWKRASIPTGCCGALSRGNYPLFPGSRPPVGPGFWRAPPRWSLG